VYLQCILCRVARVGEKNRNVGCGMRRPAVPSIFARSCLDVTSSSRTSYRAIRYRYRSVLGPARGAFIFTVRLRVGAGLSVCWITGRKAKATEMRRVRTDLDLDFNGKFVESLVSPDKFESHIYVHGERFRLTANWAATPLLINEESLATLQA